MRPFSKVANRHLRNLFATRIHLVVVFLMNHLCHDNRSF